MQNHSFRNINDCLDFLPPDELKITEFLRRLVLDAVPDITEKLSYQVPFYKKNKGMFFIWPASILWGRVQTHTGVRFGFQQGFLLTDEDGYLERGTRKQVYWRTFQHYKDIDADLLKIFIYEAALIDERFKS